MRLSALKTAIESADGIVVARMEQLLFELATTKRQPTASERTFLEDNVPLMREVAEEIAKYAEEETKPGVGNA